MLLLPSKLFYCFRTVAGVPVSHATVVQVRRSQEAADRRRRSLAAKEISSAIDETPLSPAAAATSPGGAPQVITRLVHETQIEYITRITRINNEKNGRIRAHRTACSTELTCALSHVSLEMTLTVDPLAVLRKSLARRWEAVELTQRLCNKDLMSERSYDAVTLELQSFAEKALKKVWTALAARVCRNGKNTQTCN